MSAFLVEPHRWTDNHGRWDRVYELQNRDEFEESPMEDQNEGDGWNPLLNPYFCSCLYFSTSWMILCLGQYAVKHSFPQKYAEGSFILRHVGHWSLAGLPQPGFWHIWDIWSSGEKKRKMNSWRRKQSNNRGSGHDQFMCVLTVFLGFICLIGLFVLFHMLNDIRECEWKEMKEEVRLREE